MSQQTIHFKCFECGYCFVTDDEDEDECPECGRCAYKQDEPKPEPCPECHMRGQHKLQCSKGR